LRRVVGDLGEHRHAAGLAVAAPDAAPLDADVEEPLAERRRDEEVVDLIAPPR
jgi:hypothetical protein